MSQPDNLEAQPAYVLDASALLAWLNLEPGADMVSPLLNRSVVSSVNWAEVVERSLALGMELGYVRGNLRSLGLRILPFTPDDAESTATLWTTTRRLGLSLGDRACLALARKLELPALTADRAWEDLDLGVEVQLIRQI